jgi:hypothetical protein
MPRNSCQRQIFMIASFLPHSRGREASHDQHLLPCSTNTKVCIDSKINIFSKDRDHFRHRIYISFLQSRKGGHVKSIWYKKKRAIISAGRFFISITTQTLYRDMNMHTNCNNSNQYQKPLSCCIRETIFNTYAFPPHSSITPTFSIPSSTLYYVPNSSPRATATPTPALGSMQIFKIYPKLISSLSEYPPHSRL